MKSPIVNEKRENLCDVVPLKTPYVLFIDPSNVCNFKCNFCAPQSQVNNSWFQKKLWILSYIKKLLMI